MPNRAADIILTGRHLAQQPRFGPATANRCLVTDTRFEIYILHTYTYRQEAGRAAESRAQQMGTPAKRSGRSPYSISGPGVTYAWPLEKPCLPPPRGDPPPQSTSPLARTHTYLRQSMQPERTRKTGLIYSPQRRPPPASTCRNHATPQTAWGVMYQLAPDAMERSILRSETRCRFKCPALSSRINVYRRTSNSTRHRPQT